MVLVGSLNNSKEKRIYHKFNCIYAKQIKMQNMDRLEVDAVTSNKICDCSYCGGFDGAVRSEMPNIQQRVEKENIKVYYDPNVQALYVETNNGFWKIIYDEEQGKYLLFHRNNYRSNMHYEKAMNGSFHRQNDVAAKSSFMSYIRYIIDHDKAKIIIAVDYHLLPRDTRKQKKYYACAKKKAVNRSRRNIDDIFRYLETTNEDYKQLSFC